MELRGEYFAKELVNLALAEPQEFFKHHLIQDDGQPFYFLSIPSCTVLHYHAQGVPIIAHVIILQKGGVWN